MSEPHVSARPVTAPKLPRNVKALGAVSLFTDIASDMVYPLLPIFLTSVLGAPATVLGAIEGAAQSVSSLLRLASGWWSDKVGRRKPLVVAGYALATLVRPLMAMATASWHVAVVRVSDRVGKGIRSAPRDALVADSTDPSQRGRAYGFHRAADNLGAVVGPLLAWLLVEQAQLSIRSVFWWAVVPGLVSLGILLVFVREVTVTAATTALPQIGADTGNTGSEPSSSKRDDLRLGGAFWKYLVVLLVFTLGNSSDMFLLLRASELGVATALVPVLWAAHNLVKAVSSTPGGALSDRVGRRPVIVLGWAIYAVVYLLFASATSAWHAWALFLVYGLHFGLAEGVEKALVADLVPAARRGVAFGWYNFTVGLAALPASLIFGIVWDRVSPQAAFTLGAGLAGAAAVGLMVLVPGVRERRKPAT